MFTDIDTALALTKQYAGIGARDISWDTSLVAMLEASKIITPSSFYRPWLIAAMQIWSRSASSRGQISSADGVKWLTPKEIAEAITGLLALQEAMDSGFDIPSGWAIADKRPLLCGCEKVSDVVGTPYFSAMIA